MKLLIKVRLLTSQKPSKILLDGPSRFVKLYTIIKVNFIRILNEDSGKIFTSMSVGFGSKKDLIYLDNPISFSKKTLAEKVQDFESLVLKNPYPEGNFSNILNGFYHNFRKICPYTYMNYQLMNHDLTGKNIGILNVESISKMPKKLREKEIKKEQGLYKIIQEEAFTSYMEPEEILNSFHAEQVVSVTGRTKYEDHPCVSPNIHAYLCSDLCSKTPQKFYLNYDIVNNSWVSSLNDKEKKTFRGFSKPINFNQDHIIVISAGNQKFPIYPTSESEEAFEGNIFISPTTYETTLFVGGIDTGQFKNFMDKKRGSFPWTPPIFCTPGEEKVFQDRFIVVPATNISTLFYDEQSKEIKQKYHEGTSFAAPLVSQAAALLCEAYNEELIALYGANHTQNRAFVSSLKD